MTYPAAGPEHTHCRVVVLISGNGSNLQALIDASVAANFKIAGVVSNVADAYGLIRASRDGIPMAVVDHRDFPNRESFDQALMTTIDQWLPDLVVLAGFMRILGPAFVAHYTGRILNIHPSLLPRYPGTQTHARVLAAGDREHGATVHFVTDTLDAGPVIAQARVTVDPIDDLDSLQAKVHRQEHLLYPHVVTWFAGGRLHMQDGKAMLDGDPLPPTGITLGD